MAKKKGDISKQVYKFQEGVTAVALELCGYSVDEVHWPANGRPEGLSVDVDVLVGPSVEEATMNFSIKHATSGKESEKGGWRMMRELLDSKANCPAVMVYNVMFDSLLKSAWSKILATFFDGYLELQKKNDYGPVLIEKAYTYIVGPLAGMADASAREFLRNAINERSASYDAELAEAVLLFSQDLKSITSGSDVSLQPFWVAVAKTCARKIPKVSPRVTSFKKGLAKLLILEPECREKVYQWVTQDAEIEELPRYALDLGLASQDLDGTWVIDDQHILALFQLFPEKEGDWFESIFAKSPVDRMEEKYIWPLREVSNVFSFNNYIYEHYDTLATEEGLEAALTSCFASPMKMLEERDIVGEEKSVWLFTALVALFKGVGETSQSYGLSVLADDTGMPEIAAGGFLIPPFVYREKALPGNVLSAIAGAMSKRLANIPRDSIPSLKEEIREKFVQRLVETQLIPYKSFDPIGVYLKEMLEKKGIAYEEHKSFATVAKEYAGTSSGGTTKLLEIKGSSPALVLWQSPNKNARDKAKEFSARVACLRTKFCNDNQSFSFRGYQIYMVLDGVWDQDDIDSLLRFGADRVFYPDKLACLVKALA